MITKIEEDYSWTDAILDYEEGNLSDEETLRLFQTLVNNGHAWTLQGCYGRMARALLDQGLIVPARATREERAR